MEKNGQAKEKFMIVKEKKCYLMEIYSMEKDGEERLQSAIAAKI